MVCHTCERKSNTKTKNFNTCLYNEQFNITCIKLVPHSTVWTVMSTSTSSQYNYGMVQLPLVITLYRETFLLE